MKRAIVAAVLALLVLLVVLMLLPVSGFSRGARNRCRYNMGLIGAALGEYAAHHGGAFPPSLKHLVPKYIDHEETFVCAMDHATYTYVPGLTTADPEWVVVVYEPEPYHESRRFVLYRNGEVELLDDGEFEQKLKAGRDEPREP